MMALSPRSGSEGLMMDKKLLARSFTFVLTAVIRSSYIRGAIRGAEDRELTDTRAPFADRAWQLRSGRTPRDSYAQTDKADHRS